MDVAGNYILSIRKNRLSNNILQRINTYEKNLETYYFLGICYLDKNLLDKLTVLKNDMKKKFYEKDYCKIINKIESIASEH